MEPIEVVAYVLHSLFAGLWTGSVVFVTLTVLPLAREGDLTAAALERITGKLKTVSRTSALVLFLTGSHMAAQRYTGESLTGTDGGNLVLAMVLFWFLLAATVEMGAKRLADGTGRDKVREPAREARQLFLAASILALGLLTVAGLLSANNVGFL
ncbi:hypothetical protein [Halovenus marina]|uniref:hypothetical protein n=1 Tax=Halovenus marina TaxID=3396621 RepID=UPI003F55B046